MKKNIAIAFLLAAVLGLAAVSFYFSKNHENKLTRVTVVGDSQTKIAPDTAVITFSVLTQNAQALAAQQENARKSEAVKTAVEQIAASYKREIKTSDYSLNPEQSYNYGKMPKIVGYEVKNTVTISISDLSQVGAVIDAATKAGANSVEGISFVIDEASPAQGNALALATKQAMAKAEAVAQSLNGRIVRIVETREGGAPNLQAENDEYKYAAMTANSNAARSYSTPVKAGALNVRSQIVLVVEVEAMK